MTGLERARVLLVGAGGIGAPLALTLANAGLRRLIVADDDRVEVSNLHRQILFSDADVGRPKLEAFVDALARRGVHVEAFATRALPANVEALVGGADLVLDATDNFASRFLLADACHLARVPIVHAAAVRWNATVMAAAREGGPCYRCLFEDLPDGDAPDCATAGVLGPVCGVAGALAAELALRILSSAGTSPYSFLYTFDGRRDVLRAVPIARRADCALCGSAVTISAIEDARYAGPMCELPSR